MHAFIDYQNNVVGVTNEGFTFKVNDVTENSTFKVNSNVDTGNTHIFALSQCVEINDGDPILKALVQNKCFDENLNPLEETHTTVPLGWKYIDGKFIEPDTQPIVVSAEPKIDLSYDFTPKV